jgi:hypothetical protein
VTACPHFHARYGEFEATIEVETLKVLEGQLPIRALDLVKAWASVHRGRTFRELAPVPREASAGENRSAGLERRRPMYWDVVEVKPEPGYRLFVRFADGTSGRVQLSPVEFTGVLAPLKERSFFERVFIDNGAVAWPGEIDLAPNAMYEQVVKERNPTAAR